MSTKIKIILLLLLPTLFTPSFVFAAEIRIDSYKAEVKIGEQFVVAVIVHSEKQLNAIEGRLVFPEDLLSVREIRDGNSVINFWIKKPQSESLGGIVFSGITPGGFSDPNNFVFAVVFEAKGEGAAAVTLQETTALRNDGAGTKEPLSVHNVNIVINPGDSNARKESLSDNAPPEDFTPIIARDQNIFDDKYFFVFAAQDKGSGIDHYEVKEFRFALISFLSQWVRAESPYVLKDQELKSRIVVKAIDNSGNERIATIAPRYPLSWYDHIPIIGILIVMLISCVVVFKKIWRRRLP